MMMFFSGASTACNSCGLKAGLSGSANLAYLKSGRSLEMDVLKNLNGRF